MENVKTVSTTKVETKVEQKPFALSASRGRISQRKDGLGWVHFYPEQLKALEAEMKKVNLNVESLTTGELCDFVYWKLGIGRKERKKD